MNIGIDIDGVLTNDDDYILDCATKFCYENNLTFFDNPYNYETRKFDWDKHTLNKYREQYFWDYVNNEPPRKFAQEIIKKLKDEGHNIYIITSRHLSYNKGVKGDLMRSSIIKWLNKHNIYYDKIFFSTDKTVQIQELNLDIMIEDSPLTIPTFANYVHVLCFDCRYNRDLNCSNMTRVFSWYDIYTKIQEKKLNNL